MANVDLSHKTIMITGASSGIGQAAALELARMRANLVLVCRSPERGERTVARITAETGNRNVDLLLADLSSQNEIRRVSREFLKSERPLHVLLNNAGAVIMKRGETVDGIETTFGLNHLAYFLLTHLVLDRIKQSAPARIVNVASGAHAYAGGRLNFDDLEAKRSYGGMKQYGASKLANILFTRELARRLEGTGVTTNCLHPGTVGTGFAKNNGRIATVAMTLLRPFFRSPGKGAETAVYLCASPEVEVRRAWMGRRI